MSSYKDYYDVLGVSRNADQDGIKSAYRKLAAKHHPDRNLIDSGAEERFKEINEAYTVLSDPEKRQFYNQFGTTDVFIVLPLDRVADKYHEHFERNETAAAE